MGECGRMASAVAVSRRSSTTVSVNGAAVRFSASQGRKDQVDHCLLPMTISMRGASGRAGQDFKLFAEDVLNVQLADQDIGDDRQRRREQEIPNGPRSTPMAKTANKVTAMGSSANRRITSGVKRLASNWETRK